MKRNVISLVIALLFFSIWGVGGAYAGVVVECPGDINGDGQWTGGEVPPPNTVCKHLAAGDGFINMADGTLTYIFSFSDATGILPDSVISESMLKAQFPAPTIVVKEGQQLYLTLTNVGLMMRPDLFDAHSVHFHGFPNASAFYDGEPMSTFAPNMTASFTYYYTLVDPGTFMYHCHVEATEHMQMGMLGNLYVRPLQDDNVALKNIVNPPYAGFAYNDGDGSTGYHVSYPIQIHAMDQAFHDASLLVQPPNFAELDEKYPMLNGRGYPDTINPGQLGNSMDNMDYTSQKVNSLITATAGQKILLRISNLSFDFYTLTVLGIPMKVVGRDAKLLRGPAPANRNLYYNTNSINLGGGQTADVILDTAGVLPGTYFLFTTNLNYLSNDTVERGGMMTEIVIN